MPLFYYMLRGRLVLPVAHDDWELQDIAIRRVAESYVGKIWISTVFLGLDHGLRDSHPLLFETMAFETDDVAQSDSLDDYQRRYTTYGEAEAGHAEVVEEIRNRNA